MKKRFAVFFVLAMLLCTACGVKDPLKSEVQTDYSGRYTDKQGTDTAYSELILSRNADGVYTVDVSIYRAAALYGMAADKGGVLHFVSDASTSPAIEANITINGKTAELTVTVSDFPEMPAGESYRFPDGE